MRLGIPLIASVFLGLLSGTPTSEVTFWAGIAEKWGIAGVMFLCLVWATRRIEAGDKARLEVVMQNAERLDAYHKEMATMIGNCNKVNAQVAAAIYTLANELDRRPCQAQDARKQIDPILKP